MSFSTPFVNAAGAPYSGAPIPRITAAGGNQPPPSIDPRFLKIMQTAGQTFQTATGMPVEIFNAPSASQGGRQALHVQLYDKKGKPLPNSPDHAEQLGAPLAPSFRPYEAFAQTARDIQTRIAPEFSDSFRWGGYFATGDNKLNLKHFDVQPAPGDGQGGQPPASAPPSPMMGQ